MKQIQPFQKHWLQITSIVVCRLKRLMSYRTDKLVIDGHTDTHTYTHTHAGNDNTRRPKLASGKNKGQITAF